MIVINGEYPKDCLHCNYRHCLHIGDKHYQMCGLNGDGYLTESWFKSDDLVDGFKSEHCPIQGESKEMLERNTHMNNRQSMDEYGAPIMHPIPPLLHYDESIETLYNFLHEQYTDQDPKVVEAINNAMLALYTLQDMHMKGEYNP